MFGERMKAARQALGYSAEQVAEYLKVSPATVYRYEKGDIEKMPAKTLKALADLLQVSQGYLMGWTDEEPPALYDKALSSDEYSLVSVYRSLPAKGKTYLLEQATIASVMFGEKLPNVSDKKLG